MRGALNISSNTALTNNIMAQKANNGIFSCSASRVSPHLAAELREKYTVAIVGAGAAGIGAARELKAQGITSVLILEGTDAPHYFTHYEPLIVVCCKLQFTW